MWQQGELAGGVEVRPCGEHGGATWRRVVALLDGCVRAVGRRGSDWLATLEIVAEGVCRIEPLEAAARETDDAIRFAAAGPGARGRQHDHRRQGRAKRDEGGDAGERQSHCGDWAQSQRDWTPD